MPRGKVLVLDDDEDVRSAIGDALLDIFDYGWLGAASLNDMIGLREQALGCDVAILDINLGEGVPSGLDAFEWLKGQGFAGRIVFLTGHARSHPLVDRARRDRAAAVFQKPLSLDQLGGILVGRGP
jgi:DNA-binding NtrC family response regulator